MATSIDYEKLAQQVLQSMVTTKAVSSTPTATYGHGPGGLFSSPGLSQPVFSAMILPRLGLQELLPTRPSRDMNPLFGIMTGVTASSGAEPTGVCDDPPVAGLMKLCTHSFVYGRQSRMSKVFDLDRVGQITNRGEFMDLSLQGNPWQGGNMNIPGTAMSGATNPLNTEVGKSMFEMAVAWARDFAKEIYTGNPTNNTAGGGRKYFHGLDTLINTGYRDAETGIACPAADSIVRSFGSLDVSSNGAAIVRAIANVYRNLKFIAANAGLDPVTWVITMPTALFYEITEIYPCAYQTYRCQNSFSSSQTQVIDSAALIAMRDAMRGDIFERKGQYLLIDGTKVPVVLDDAVAETVLPGESFLSSMYFVPLTALSGTPVTYWEYRNYDEEKGPMEAAKAFAPDGHYYTSDSGRFMWHKKPPTNFCVQLLAKTEPRLVFLTPHLAARITNIKYTPLAHERSPFTDSSFFVNGGRTGGATGGPSYFTPTA